MAARQLVLDPLLEVSDTGFILDMVQWNLGLSFLPQYVVENSIYRDRLQVLSVKDFRMYMYRQLFYHKDKWLTQAMKLFWRWRIWNRNSARKKPEGRFLWKNGSATCTGKVSMI